MELTGHVVSPTLGSRGAVIHRPCPGPDRLIDEAGLLDDG
jgi:hypothetical protein